jgi:hypothetical protein
MLSDHSVSKEGVSIYFQILSDDTMQKVATEMNISETAFVRKLHSQDTFGKRKYYSQVYLFLRSLTNEGGRIEPLFLNTFG